MPLIHWFTTESITSQGYNNKLGQSKADWTRFTTRHHGGGDLLFADGHVAWFKWTQVQVQLPWINVLQWQNSS